MTDAPRRVRMLSFHAGYACAHSNECCSAGWPIPVESAVLPVLRQALDSGAVLPASPGEPLTFPTDRPTSVGAVLGRTPATGACVFLDPAQPGGSCRVHRHAGVASLPMACRQFPRVARHDARGTDITLSHFCPTARAMLARPGPVSIVEWHDTDATASRMEGLDARAAWPPLLRPDCLFDLEAYESFERHAVALLTLDAVPVATRLARLHAWGEFLRPWTPASGPLLDLVHHSLDDAMEGALPPSLSLTQTRHARDVAAVDDELWRGVVDAIPHEWRGQLPDGILVSDTGATSSSIAASAAWQHRIGRYLAARLFASWVAYQGEGVRSTLAAVHAAWVAVRRAAAISDARDPRDASNAPVEACVDDAIRIADLALVHLASPEALAAHYRRWEDASCSLSVSSTHAASAP